MADASGVAMVTGSRELQDWAVVWRALDSLSPELVIIGDCDSGADLHAFRWCMENKRAYLMCQADWSRSRRAAGPIRNSAMVRWAKKLNAIVLAFPRGGPGTRDCMKKARSAGLTVSES